jgi:hypothetical protein
VTAPHALALALALGACAHARPSTSESAITPTGAAAARAQARPAASEPRSGAIATTTPTQPVASAPPPVAEASEIVAPATEPSLAALPVDVRLSSWTSTLASHRPDCKAFARASACELVVDLDGDGKPERAVKLRERSSGRAGIGIRWADGTVSIVGAGASSRQLATDVYEDGVDLSWREVEDDWSFLARWSVARHTPAGFAIPRGRAPSRPGSGAAPPRSLRAPAALGGGLWLDGGDAAEVLYWDGARWRRLVAGF